MTKKLILDKAPNLALYADAGIVLLIALYSYLTSRHEMQPVYIYKAIVDIGRILAWSACGISMISLFLGRSKKLALVALIASYMALGGMLFLAGGGDPFGKGRANPPFIHSTSSLQLLSLKSSRTSAG